MHAVSNRLLVANMSGFSAVNHPGAFYHSNPNPLLVVCLSPDVTITRRGLHLHKRVVVKHLFERGVIPAMTRGPRVPTWAQFNNAWDQIEERGWVAACSLWGGRSGQLQHTWNAFASPGSREALLPWDRVSQPCECGDCSHSTSDTNCMQCRDHTGRVILRIR